jgi:hypothetical protein
MKSKDKAKQRLENMKTHYIITMTTRNRNTNPLIACHHDKQKALDKFNEMSRITHYYYKLTGITDTQKQEIRSEYYDFESQVWKDTSTLYQEP